MKKCILGIVFALTVFSSCAVETGDHSAPKVNIYSPQNGDSMPLSFKMKGKVSDKFGIESVFVTAKKSGETNEIIFPAEISYAIYTAEIVLPDNGEYVFTAQAVDSNGNISISAPTTVFISPDARDYAFIFYSLPHWIGLFFVILFNVLMVVILKKLKNEKAEKITAFILAFLLLFDEAILILWHIGIGDFRPGHNIPLHLCGIAVLLSPVMLITKNKKLQYFLYELIFFWGLGGAVQALLTPDIGDMGFPKFRYFSFFISHGVIVAAPVFMTFIKGLRPTFKSIWKTLGITNLYMIFIFFINWAVQFIPPYEVGNYLFVTYPPVDGSVIDLLVAVFGPAPWYIIGLELVAVVSFLVYYSPFFIADIIKKLSDKNTA